MSIEFHCSQCSKTLRVAARNAGKKCKCPSCGAMQSIPNASSFYDSSSDDSSRPGALGGRLPAVRKIPAAGSSQEAEGLKVEIACPKCRTTLIYSPELEGTRGLCKGCGHIFTLSSDRPEVVLDAETFPFQCPKCEFLFEGKPEMEGRRGKCTECQSVFVIEKLKPKKPTVAPVRGAAMAANRQSQAKLPPPTAIVAKSNKPQSGSVPEAIPTAIPTAIPMAMPQDRRELDRGQSGNAFAWDAIDLKPSVGQAHGSASQATAYSVNPYSVSNYSESSSASLRSVSSGSVDIVSIAVWHRKLLTSLCGLILILPVYVGFIVAMFALINPQNPGGGAVQLIIWVGLGSSAMIMFGLGILLLISYIILCTKLYETGMALVMIVGYFIGGVVPLLPLIMLLVVAGKGSSLLRARGYTVGLLGVSASQLR